MAVIARSRVSPFFLAQVHQTRQFSMLLCTAAYSGPVHTGKVQTRALSCKHTLLFADHDLIGCGPVFPHYSNSTSVSRLRSFCFKFFVVLAWLPTVQ